MDHFGEFYEPTTEHLSKMSGPWCCSYSGGKDSTSLVTWIEWLRRSGWLTVDKPQLVQSDTEVEYDVLAGISNDMMELLRKHGWECAVVKPKINEKLYNRILGIGNTPIHPGIRSMRWCTRSTKIDPMERWRAINSSGLTLTGLRWGESKIRDGKLVKRGCQSGGECGMPDTSDQTYSPIIDWKTCQVLDWLNGWIKSEVFMDDVFKITRRLVDVYAFKIEQQGFDFHEPDVSGARFGCIGCPAISATRNPPRATIVRHGQDSPLNELYDVWFEARRRCNRLFRINKKGEPGYGPTKMAVRKSLFARVMSIQDRSGVVLITPEDEKFIRNCWENKVYPRGWSELDELVESPSDTPLFELPLVS